MKHYLHFILLHITKYSIKQGGEACYLLLIKKLPLLIREIFE